MPPFLSLDAVAAKRGEGLRPELRALFERLATAPSYDATVRVTAWFNQVGTRLPRKQHLRKRRSGENRTQTQPPLSRRGPPVVKTIRPTSRTILEPGWLVASTDQ
jgi:hypothetical protein